VSGLIDQAGHPIEREQLAGQHVRLLFFRTDVLPTCPVLGCDSPGIAKAPGRTYGISLDAGGDTTGFIQRFGESFDLLVDLSGDLARAYGINQDTPLPCIVHIGPNGQIRQIG